MARKRKEDREGKQAMMPVMRTDAAGIDIGATEIFVAVPPDRAPEKCAFISDLHAGLVRPGGMVEAVWCADSGDGIHGGLLDSAIPDFGGAWF